MAAISLLLSPVECRCHLSDNSYRGFRRANNNKFTSPRNDDENGTTSYKDRNIQQLIAKYMLFSKAELDVDDSVNY